ncbi:MAG TPA: hypothetical protein VFZ14_02030 [Burkholderiales bacterium]|nr:hypothetical protein [Burkholderiales bacterium]
MALDTTATFTPPVGGRPAQRRLRPDRCLHRRKPPDGELTAWAIQTASAWRIGAEKDDTGLVVFVFTEPHLARIIFAIRKELSGDDADSIHARAAEARKRADLAAESFFTRKGSFSGAGAAIVWPLQAR